MARIIPGDSDSGIFAQVVFVPKNLKLVSGRRLATCVANVTDDQLELRCLVYISHQRDESTGLSVLIVVTSASGDILALE